MYYKHVTIIVSIYDNVEALEVVLNSLQKQTYKDFDLIVSEDAEHDSVASFLKNYDYQGNLMHLHHWDNGWQKNLALNNAIRNSRSDYLIFVDGDCVLHPSFIENHMRLAGPQKIVAGKRIKLDPYTSKLLLTGTLDMERMNHYILRNFWRMKKNKAQFIEEGFFLHPKKLLGFLPQLRSMRNLKGCNMSFPKQAIEAINGFDEDYIRPAIGEDIDLTWRFSRAGYKIVSARNTAVQYHLWHKENWTDQSENIKLMKEKQARDEVFCKNGLVK